MCRLCDEEKMYAKGLCRKCYLKEWHTKNRESEVAKSRQYYSEHKETINAQCRTWYGENKQYYREYYKKSDGCEKSRMRYTTNLNHRVAQCLRARINSSLREQHISIGNTYSRPSLEKLLGCSIEELKIYLENKFQEGMTWENHGLYGWHIDHILPLASFDLTDDTQLLIASHYTNLQPLWAKDNLSKGNRVPIDNKCL